MSTRRITHRQAVAKFAVERYLINDMSVEERAAFERHFLNCGECLQSLLFGADFMDAGRQISAENRKREKLPRVGSKPSAIAPK
jgi:hypothetical protein